jgi:hypothetical protein
MTDCFDCVYAKFEMEWDAEQPISYEFDTEAWIYCRKLDCWVYSSCPGCLDYSG